MTADALAKCPGCGSVDHPLHDDVLPGDGDRFRVRCPCGWIGPGRRRREAAHAEWSRRAPALAWRSEPPDVEGLWLWRTHPSRHPNIVLATAFHLSLLSPLRTHQTQDGLEWAGPIPEPEEGGE